MKNPFKTVYRSKYWSRLFLYAALFLCILLPIFLNLIIDPYSIFHTNILKNELSVNERFNKIDYLKSNPSKYNSFLLGNSRIGTTDPHMIEEYLPDSRFYNLTLSAANMEDMITHLEYLIQHNGTLDTIYLQLDYQDMIYWGHDEKNYEYKKHPGVSHLSHLEFYMSYLLIFPFETFKEKINRNLFPPLEKQVVYDINDTGMWIAKRKEQLIEQDPKNYVLHEPSFHMNTMDIWMKNESVYPKMLTALCTIVALAEQHHINLILYTTPYNHAMLNNFLVDDILTYLNDISKIHSFYFFSDYNSITLDDTNYYEAGHFRGKVSNLIAARIFNDKKTNIPSDFGMYIMQNNFEKYRESICHNFKLHREKLKSQ